MIKNENLELRYYQYKLGRIGQFNGEMHASIYEILFDHQIINSRNPFLRQIVKMILKRNESSDHIQNHIKRGINISNNNHTKILASPNYPIKNYESTYLLSKPIEYGLSGGDTTIFEADFLKEDYYYFWESTSPLSQWYICEFSIEGIKFTSAEQYMMYKKAKLFGDGLAADEILKTDSPRAQKAIGRSVNNFDKKVWAKNAIDIVYQGNYQKFIQNDEIKSYLLDTKGKTIVESSPYDKIWGIGLSRNDAESQDIRLWNGMNWLGIVLTELREEFLSNSAGIGYWAGDELRSKHYYKYKSPD